MERVAAGHLRRIQNAVHVQKEDRRTAPPLDDRRQRRLRPRVTRVTGHHHYPTGRLLKSTGYGYLAAGGWVSRRASGRGAESREGRRGARTRVVGSAAWAGRRAALRA